MKDDYNSILILLEQKGLLSESFDLEFKSAKGGFPRSFWESYSSFANTEGGTIVLGVAEKDDICYYDGLPEMVMRKYKEDFWNQVNNKEKVSSNLLLESDVQLVEVHADIFLLLVMVPKADYRIRPVYVGPDPMKGSYKRCSTGDYKCTPDEVRRMLADSFPEKPDSRILEGFSLEDLDALSIKQYRQLLSSAKPGHPFLTLEDKDLLTKLGGWKKDRRTKKEGLTVAGLLMFGKTECITEVFPDYHLDYQEISDTEERWSDRVYPDGTWEVNLFQFFHLVWPKISRTLPKSFKLMKGQRRDESVIHEALREALANALIHTDYSGLGGIVIKKYVDYFLFSNPGSLLISLAQYYRGGISIPRNCSIQTMFLLLGYGEKAGSGSVRIMNAWEGAHWRKPLLHLETYPERVELYLNMEQLLPQKSLDKLVSIFGKDVLNLYGDGLIALTTAEMEGCVSNTRLQQLVNKHSSEISQLLKDLCNEGFLNPENKGRWTVYRLRGSLDSTGTQKSFLFGKVDTSDRKVDTSDRKVDTSDRKVDTSDRKVDTSEKSKPKHLNFEDLKAQILDFCSEEYKSADEIAVFMERDLKYLKNKILPSLFNEDCLERLYPTIPNHPNQAYRAKK